MAEGLSSYLATALLNAICNNTSFSVPNIYVQLHVGAPGAAGTANQAAETTRKAVSFGTALTGAVTNDAAIEWASITGTEDSTHYTLWDAITGGNFLISGVLTANSYSSGDGFIIAIGDIDITWVLAS